MRELTASGILDAIERGDIESIHDGGAITVLIDLKPVLLIPESPALQVRKTFGNAVIVRSGDVTVATIQADDKTDAEQIADAMTDLLAIG